MMHNPWSNIQWSAERTSTLRVNKNHPLDWFWAVDHSGRYIVFCDQIEIPADIKLPEIQGLESFLSRSSYNTELKQIVLVLRDNVNWELFYSLCMDLIHTTALANQANAFQIIIRRLQRWQTFLKKNRQELLSEKQIKGLLGELIFLDRHLAVKYGYADAIRFWTGPTGTPQDFCIEDMVVEVKTQESSTRPEVHISSAEQLSNQANHLYLFVVTLGKGERGCASNISLRSIISGIQKELQTCPEQLELFQNLLLSAGCVNSENYDSYVYNLIETATYDVREDFPRITVEDLPMGIIKLDYNISLTGCRQYKICSGWINN